MADTQQIKAAIELASRSSDKVVLDIKGVVGMTTLSQSVIYDLVKQGKFPKQMRIGPNRVVWLRSEVLDWLHAKLAEGTAKQAQAA